MSESDIHILGVGAREEETVLHLLHYPRTSALWATCCASMGLCWVRADQLSNKFGYARYCYHSPQVGLGIISLSFDFVVGLKEQNKRAFEDEESSIQYLIPKLA